MFHRPSNSSNSFIALNLLKNLTLIGKLFKNFLQIYLITRKAIDMLNLVETFWLQQEDDHNNFLRTIQKIKDEVKNIKHGALVQTSILKYFSSS